MSFIDKILLNETYVYKGNKDVLLKKLKTNKKVSQSDKNEYSAKEKYSFGVLTANGIPLNNGIKVFFSIEECSPSKYYIRFRTKLRMEHYFLITLFLSFIIGSSLSSETPYYISLFIFGLWIIFHLWFHFVFRCQEQGLTEDIVANLKVKKIRKL